MARNMNEELEAKKVESSGIVRTDTEKKMHNDKLLEFCKTREKQIIAWYAAHPGIKPPIFWDDRTQDFYWANREQRKRAMALAKKQRVGKQKLILPEHLEGDRYGERNDGATDTGPTETSPEGRHSENPNSA
jgi:hypothetical protein